MARPKKSEEVDVDQLEIPEKRYMPRNGSVLMPVTADGKTDWVAVPSSRFDKAAQDTLLNFWDKCRQANPTFSIEAKIAKLLIEVVE